MTPHSVVRNAWYVAGLSKDFPKETLSGHVIAKRPIVMWRTKDGEVVAFDDRCCAQALPVVEGAADAGRHARMRLPRPALRHVGQVRDDPVASDGPISPQAKVIGFPVIEQDGLVWIWPGDPALAEMRQPPRLPEVGDDRWDSIVVGPMQVPANYLLLIENLLDITHFYPLHDGNIGDVANSQIPIELEEGRSTATVRDDRSQNVRTTCSRRISSTGSATRPSTAIIRIA